MVKMVSGFQLTTQCKAAADTGGCQLQLRCFWRSVESEMLSQRVGSFLAALLLEICRGSLGAVATALSDGCLAEERG